MVLRLKTQKRAAENEVTEKTKGLFSMFHLGGYEERYEPQLMGGSAAIAATTKQVEDWKALKTKALFEMFHLNLT